MYCPFWLFGLVKVVKTISVLLKWAYKGSSSHQRQKLLVFPQHSICLPPHSPEVLVLEMRWNESSGPQQSVLNHCTGLLKCSPLPPRLHRWGSNVKWSVHKKGEVIQRAKGIVGRSGPERESREWRDWKDSGRKSGRVAQVREWDGVILWWLLISWNLSRSRPLSLISVLTFLLIVGPCIQTLR